jgi:uncharacterized repeat protein (TIGR01451 family)
VIEGVMKKKCVHDGNRWLLSLTAMLLLAAALAGLVPGRTAGAQQVPLLTVTKVADNATITAGDEIGFTITITSTNNGDVTLVHLTDQLFNVLPSAPSWTETTGNASCTIDGSNLLSCDFASIVSSAPPIMLHVTAPTAEQDCGQTSNDALVGFDDFNGRSQSVTSNTASVEIVCPTATSTPTDIPTSTPTDTPTSTGTATATQTAPATETPPIVCCAESPTATVDLGATQTAVAGATETAAAQQGATVTPTSAVSELPETGSGRRIGSDRGYLWLLIVLVAAVVAVVRLHVHWRR